MRTLLALMMLAAALAVTGAVCAEAPTLTL